MPIIRVLVIEEDDRLVQELRRYNEAQGKKTMVIYHLKTFWKVRNFRSSCLAFDFVLIHQNQFNQCKNIETITKSLWAKTKEIILLCEEVNRYFLFDSILNYGHICMFKTQVKKIPEIIYSIHRNPLSKREWIIGVLIDEIDRLWRNDEKYRKEKEISGKLTPTEFKVYQLKKSGKKIKEIASELCIAEKTVKNHISNILKNIRSKV